MRNRVCRFAFPPGSGENGGVSFLDNLENNLKALESNEQGGHDSRRRNQERGRALAAAPWAERLRREPYAQKIMREATVAGHSRRMKVNLAWIDTTLRLEARGNRLELRPTSEGVVAAFFRGTEEVGHKPVDLSADPKPLVAEWMVALDEQKRIDEANAPPPEPEE